MILCVSSNNVGINLKAIEIIIAIICTGNPIFLNGDSKCSIPNVKSSGLVVAVKIVVIIMINTKRITIYAVCSNAPLYISINPNEKSNFPDFINNKLKNIKNIIINNIGFIALTNCLVLILERSIIKITYIDIIPYPIKPASKKTVINRINNAPILSLGSNLCTNESIGIYLPNIILFMKFSSYCIN